MEAVPKFTNLYISKANIYKNNYNNR